MKRDDLATYLNDYLRVKAIDDESNNGLQVEGAGEVTRLALAVDASLSAIQGAADVGAQMLIVHHGLFWGKPLMVTGIHYRRLKRLFEADLSLYGVHLPLDLHEEVGNNAVLARWLNLEEVTSFGEYHGMPVGMAGWLPAAVSLGDFAAQVEKVVQEQIIQIWPFGPSTVRQVGIVSGGAAFLLDQAAAAGVDVYLTGEVSHSAYHTAHELGLNVVFGGHYATETVGLKALAEHLSDKFDLETVFLDLPTGA
ncbi:MAG: Nif3-like dinuclear metal center hexameric protein [Anaerolineae bacterium]|nr:Nif3-like dinuclear metal center hexameric protein [Anaerolineae bacterium]